MIFFYKPQKKRILIYDANNSKLIINYLYKKDYEVLCTRREKFSLFIILKCLLKKKFSFREYYIEYIKYVNPKIVITYIDNNPFFYELKNRLNVKTMFIQNGLRTAIGDIFQFALNKNFKISKNVKKKKFSVDYMLVWNHDIGKFLNKFINGKYFSIGSFANNFFVKKNIKSKNDIIFISCSRFLKNKNAILNGISYNNYIKNEKKFYFYLENFCEENKFGLHILGKTNYNSEFQYYRENFSKKFHFIARTKDRNAYDILCNYKYIVTFDSSLGYEMLIKGKKVGFFSRFEENIYPYKTIKFGWLQKIKNKGPFWTDKINKKEVYRILQFLIKTKESFWKKRLNNLALRLINFDKNNSEFKRILSLEGIETKNLKKH